MCRIRSGASVDYWTIDPTNKAGRVTLYDTAGRAIADESKAIYMASGSFTPVATPTDLVTIFGSASKIVRVRSMRIGTTNTAAGSQIFLLIKRSAVDTGGTAVSATLVPGDSANSAATATVQHYTANAAGLGTAVGTINTLKVASPVLVPATFAGIVQQSEVEVLPSYGQHSGLPQPITLRSASEGLAINFNGAALVSGQIHTYNVVWTEEATF